MKQLITIFIIALFSFPTQAQKKVYADYHGVRYTREHDGKLGRWGLFANTAQSATGKKTICYNADLILENGQHEIAAVAYPQAGMQSNLDPDYIEYQILSAKTAKIDGFFIEWGFIHHENNTLLKAMQKVAEKYNFEIGVNWCDGWIYYDWITKINPRIETRAEKTEYYAKCYQYLIDSVFNVPTAPTVKGMPVFYHFGPGAAPREYELAYSKTFLPENMKAPRPLRRWADWGTLKNDIYTPVTHSDEIDKWVKLGMIPTAWLPARVRPMDETHPHWDHYAESQDLIEFMKPFRDSIWNSENPDFDIKSGFVMPGMDNRGCAGWGRGHFYYIPRNNGDTYRRMWEFNLDNKDKLDMVFIASWSDYTEGHEIEPTIENGDRDLRMTLEYAARFKNEVADSSGIRLPLELFNQRKRSEFLEASGIKQSATVKAMNNIAQSISKGEYAKAAEMLRQNELMLKKAETGLASRQVAIPEDNLQLSGKQPDGSYLTEEGLSLILSPELSKELNRRNYRGTITFEYQDTGFEVIRIYCESQKTPRALFCTVAAIQKNNSGEWKQAKIELYKGNILYMTAKPSFRIKGKGAVRNISLNYDIH